MKKIFWSESAELHTKAEYDEYNSDIYTCEEDMEWEVEKPYIFILNDFISIFDGDTNVAVLDRARTKTIAVDGEPIDLSKNAMMKLFGYEFQVA